MLKVNELKTFVKDFAAPENSASSLLLTIASKTYTGNPGLTATALKNILFVFVSNQMK